MNLSKRVCAGHFITKRSDADTQNTQQQYWFDFALACLYIDKKTFTLLVTKSNDFGKLIGCMIIHPE